VTMIRASIQRRLVNACLPDDVLLSISLTVFSINWTVAPHGVATSEACNEAYYTD